MRSLTRHWCLLALAVCTIVCGVLALYFAGPAWSQGPVIEDYANVYDDAICAGLDEFPTIPGVMAVLDVVAEDSGLSAYDTGAVVALAVMSSCPRHEALLRRFADIFAPKRAAA
jgi:hypothetical protein